MLKVPIVSPDEQDSDKQYTNFILKPFVNSDLFPLKFEEEISENIVNSTSDLGKELLKASADGDLSKIRNLLAHGAPFSADWLGTSPLHLAAQGNHVEVCDILIRAGISSNVRTKVDRTPLHFAASNGHLEMVNLLLLRLSDINSVDLLGMTPLHWAVQNGHIKIVQALLKHGADKDIRSKFDLKPRDIAIQINCSEILELLENNLEEWEEENIVINSNGETCNMERNECDDQEDLLEDEQPLDSCSIEIEEEDGEVNMDVLEIEQFDQNSTSSCSYQDSMRILQEHGITMLPNDDNNILSSVMESGHSVVLTDVGKELLNSVKVVDNLNMPEINPLPKVSNYIKVSSSDLIPLNANVKLKKSNKTAILKPVNVNRPIKRIVMKKYKGQLTTKDTQVPKKVPSEMEIIMKQLSEARETIEEYKKKLLMKEAEAELYKMQLKHALKS